MTVDRGGQRAQPARDPRPRGLLGDAEARRHRRVAQLVDDAQAHRLALLGPELGQRALDRRAQLAQGRELLDADLLLGLERRRLDAQARQGPALARPRRSASCSTLRPMPKTQAASASRSDGSATKRRRCSKARA